MSDMAYVSVWLLQSLLSPTSMLEASPEQGALKRLPLEPCPVSPASVVVGTAVQYRTCVPHSSTVSYTACFALPVVPVHPHPGP